MPFQYDTRLCNRECKERERESERERERERERKRKREKEKEKERENTHLKQNRMASGCQPFIIRHEPARVRQNL